MKIGRKMRDLGTQVNKLTPKIVIDYFIHLFFCSTVLNVNDSIRLT